MAMLRWLGIHQSFAGRFQLVPGYPLDGGRVLRALIWWKTGDADRSTQLAARAGQAVAFAFIALGIFQFFAGAGIGGLWIAFIGWFLLQAARESYSRSGLAHALEGVKVADIMTRDCPTVDGWLNVQNFVEHEMLRTGQRCFMVVDKGEITGLVTSHEVKTIDKAKWPYKTLHDIMRPLEDLQSVTPDTSLTNALEAMGRYDLNQLPVVANGQLEGCCRARKFSIICRRTPRSGAREGSGAKDFLDRFYDLGVVGGCGAADVVGARCDHPYLLLKLVDCVSQRLVLTLAREVLYRFRRGLLNPEKESICCTTR